MPWVHKSIEVECVEDEHAAIDVLDTGEVVVQAWGDYTLNKSTALRLARAILETEHMEPKPPPKRGRR